MRRTLQGALPVGALGSLLLVWSGGAAGAGSEFNLSCEPHEVLIGISGRQAWWMVGIGARCRSVAPDGALRGAVRTTGWGGGTTGARQTFDCGSSEVMVGYRGTQGDNGYLLDVHEIVCAGWHPHSRRAVGATRTLAAFERKTGPGRLTADACANGQVGTRLRGRAGQYLDRLMDMGCSDLAGTTSPTRPTQGDSP